MSFTPPLPPPLPSWPPFMDDDHSPMASMLRRPPPPGMHAPPPPPLPPAAPPLPAFGASDTVSSFRSLSVIRNCDTNLRRMNSAPAAPPGFDVPQAAPPRHLRSAFDTNDLNLSSSSQWGSSNSFGLPSSSVSSSFGSAPLTSSSSMSSAFAHNPLSTVSPTTSSTTSSHWSLSPADIERKAVEILVDKTFGSDGKVNGALVDWLDDPMARWQLGSCFQNLRRDAIVFRDGTSFKNDYDILVARLAAHFMGAAQAVHDATTEKKLTTFLLQRVALTKGDEYFIKRFVWACDGVRVIGEAASRTGNLGLSDDEVRDLCACIRSLATALPPIARQLEVAKRLVHITSSVGSLTVSASTSRSTTPTTSPIVSPTLTVKKDVKENDGTPPSSWASVVTTTPVKQPTAAQPTRGTDDSLQFFDEAPELDGMKRVQVFRLKRHCALQPKASLCPPEVSSAPDHNPQTCQFSHSLLEVMTYSPLFKLFVCNEDRHYGDDAHERSDCPFLHVDVGFKTEWMDDFARGKRSYCVGGSKCANKTCLKSHSFAEMCWYNPWYKIQRCERGCTETSLACRYFHEGSGDRRYLELDDDHVGHAIEIPFVSRTHDALIKKLKALGL